MFTILVNYYCDFCTTVRQDAIHATYRLFVLSKVRVCNKLTSDSASVINCDDVAASYCACDIARHLAAIRNAVNQLACCL